MTHPDTNPGPARCNQKWRMKCSQWETDDPVSQQFGFADKTNFRGCFWRAQRGENERRWKRSSGLRVNQGCARRRRLRANGHTPYLRRMKSIAFTLMTAFACATALAAGSKEAFTDTFAVDKADLASSGTNRFFILAPGFQLAL